MPIGQMKEIRRTRPAKRGFLGENIGSLFLCKMNRITLSILSELLLQFYELSTQRLKLLKRGIPLGLRMTGSHQNTLGFIRRALYNTYGVGSECLLRHNRSFGLLDTCSNSCMLFLHFGQLLSKLEIVRAG